MGDQAWMEEAEAYARCLMEEVNVKEVVVGITKRLEAVYDGAFYLRLEGRILGEPRAAAYAFLNAIETAAGRGRIHGSS